MKKRITIYLKFYNSKNRNISNTRYLNGIVAPNIDEHRMFKECLSQDEYDLSVYKHNERGTLIANIDNKLALFYEDSSGASLDDSIFTDFSVIIKNDDLYNKLRDEIKFGQYKDIIEFDTKG